MNRAPNSLAPSWLPRQQRRHIDRQLRRLMRPGTCSICGSPFRHNSRHGERPRRARQCRAGGRVLHRPGRRNLREGALQRSPVRLSAARSCDPHCQAGQRSRSPTRSRLIKRSLPKPTR